MPYIPLPMQVGVFTDDSALAAQGAFTDANQIRFLRGRPQTRFGWATATNDVVQGKCRGMHAWNSRGTTYYALGTHTHLQMYRDGAIFDITPIVSLGSVSNPFTTIIGEEEVAFVLTAHGMEDGQRIVFPGYTSINGATVSDPDGYEVNVVNDNAISFIADTPATSSGSGVGGTVDYDILLAPGLENGLGGPGYGVGGFGLGGYSQGADEAEYFPRTWSLDNWVSNLVALPRGDTIYEFAPNLSSGELVTNGDFSSATGWTAGTGWTIAAGVATATSGFASLLSTEIETLPNSYLMLEFNMTRSAGTLGVTIEGVSVVSGLNSTTRVRRIVYTAAGGTLALSKDASFVGVLDGVSVTQMTRAAALPGAPSRCDTMLVEPELIIKVFGCIDADTGFYNPMQVRNSDTGDGNLQGNQTWTPSPSNLAYRFTLGVGGRCVAGHRATGETLVWTDAGLYRSRYTGNPNQPYTYQLIAGGGGLIGTQAATVLGGSNAYWMTPSKQFQAYDGGGARVLDCTIQRNFADYLSPAQYDKIFAVPISAFGEVCWHYNDVRDGNECSRYALHGTSGQAWWAPGLFDRTAWIDAFGANPPMAVSAEGVLYFQETGYTADGDVFSWMLRTGAMDVKINGDGGELYQVDFFIPDEDDLQGGYNYTMFAYELPNATAEVHGPFGVTSATERLDFDPPIARQVVHLFEGNSAPSFCRFGSPRLDVSNTGMVF